MKRPGSFSPRSAPLRPTRKAALKRSGIKKANRKRKAANLERAHGPAERRAWIKTLPCANCGIVGYSEGAHIKNGGMARKAEASQTIPLCGWHPSAKPGGHDLMGCHAAQHGLGWNWLHGLGTPEKREAAAERIENLWQLHLRQTGRARQETE